MKINYFENVKSRTPLETTLEALVQSLRSSDSLRASTEAYRKALAEDKDKATEIKKTFAGFLPAALVTGRRKRENMTALTGLMMCDFDHVPLDRLPEIRQKVNADPHTVVSYITLSGEGLRILAAYTTEENTEMGGDFDIKTAETYYRKMFNAINQYYAQLIGCDFDPACKDLSRLSFAAFDAETFYRPDATPFQPLELGVLNKEQRKEKKEAKRQQNKTKHIIGKVYKQFIQPSITKDGVEYGPGTHNNYVMRVGYQLNKYGFELATAQAWATEQFPEYAEAANVVGYCYSRTEEHGEWEDRVKNAIAASSNSGQKLPRATRVDIYIAL